MNTYKITSLYRTTIMMILAFSVIENTYSITTQEISHLEKSHQHIKEILIEKNSIKTINKSGKTIEHNVLTQQMLNQKSINYIIQYDFDLKGATITIPENCILNFQGGSLKNGKIIFSQTKLTGFPQIYTEIEGTIDVPYLNVKWFGVMPGVRNNQNERMQKIIDFYKDNVPTNSWDLRMIKHEPYIYIPNGVYNLGTIYIRSYVDIRGAGRAGTELKNTTFVAKNSFNIKLSDFSMVGNSTKDTSTWDFETDEGREIKDKHKKALYFTKCAYVCINNITISNYDIGFAFNEVYGVTIIHPRCVYNGIGYYNKGANFGNAGHDIHTLGGEFQACQYGIVNIYGHNVRFDNTCVEGCKYGFYLMSTGTLSITKIYFEANYCDIYGNISNVNIDTNFFSSANKPSNSYYILGTSFMYSSITNNLFAEAKTNNHIVAKNDKTQVIGLNIMNNDVASTHILLVDDKIKSSIKYDGYIKEIGYIENTTVPGTGKLSIIKNPSFNKYGLAVNTPQGTFNLRGVPKSNIPINLSEWDLETAGRQLTETSTGCDAYYNYYSKPIWWNGKNWVDANGFKIARGITTKGKTSERPTTLTSNDIGFLFFDTNYNKPIWWTGTKWVDANGNEI